MPLPNPGQRAACMWVEDGDGVWETQCGHTFELIEGTPLENEFAFCPHCGGVLGETLREWDTED